MESQKIEIKQSKNMTGLVCCFILTAASIFILIRADQLGSFSPSIVRLIGYIGLLFFGLGGVITIYKEALTQK